MPRFNLKTLSSITLGISLLTGALFLAVALLSFNIHDPSFNHASSSDVSNYAGPNGAFIADPVLQSIGLACIPLIIFLIVSGIKLIFLKEGRFFLLKLSLLCLFLPVFATTFAFINSPKNNFISSYGGFIGTFIKEELTLSFEHNHVFFAVLGLSILGALISININWQEAKLIFPKIANTLVRILKFSFWIVYIVYVFIRNRVTKSDSLEDNADDISFSIQKPKARIEIKTRTPSLEAKKPPLQSSFKLDPNEFELPSTALLKEHVPLAKKSQHSEAALNQNSKLLQQVLMDFGVSGKILSIRPGPVVTLYELEPSAGTKSSRVIGLADDISRSMSAISARIAVIPGKNALGIELPNSHREIVYLRELMESSEYASTDAKLPLILGKNIGGEPIIVDLAKMPHLLVAGTTGSGKSVAINTMILSLLYQLSPRQCQFIMIDPKMLELSVYEGIPHLITPVVTEPKKAVVALKWVVKEMENRYRAMSTLGVRNILGFNKAIEEAVLRGQILEKQIQTGFDKASGQPIFESVEMPKEALPYIVVIVDEMADLMLVAGKDIECYIQRLAQMARAAGIHIIMATQRPSVDVITGVIKANFPTRVSFQVTSKIDSRTILGEQGAEQLLGMGDMLYMMGGGKIDRVHGPFVGDKEVESVVAFLKTQGEPKYIEEVVIDEDEDDNPFLNDLGDSDDNIYKQAVSIVLKDRRPTTSYIQRCLKIGYNRAASLIERMENDGILSSPNHTGKREILVDEQ